MSGLGIIYRLTNTAKDNWPYVGQTVGSLEERWDKHVRDAREDARLDLHKAIREYGSHVFTREILETCELDELDDYEILWIARSDSFHSGYNMTSGGIIGKGDGHARWGVKKVRPVQIEDDASPRVCRLSTSCDADPDRRIMLRQFIASLSTSQQAVVQARLSGHTFDEIGLQRGTNRSEAFRVFHGRTRLKVSTQRISQIYSTITEKAVLFGGVNGKSD